MSDKKYMMQMIAGLDIGNGYVKGFASTDGNKGSGIDFPSGVAVVVNDRSTKVRPVAAGPVIDDIFNEMAATFDTPAVHSKALRIFGARGVNADGVMEEFDVSSHRTKAEQDLSVFLVLGCIAGRALQDYYAKYKALPDDILHVNARIALALPISEFKDYRKVYADKFTSVSHVVSIQNFEEPVRVEIRVSDAQVMAEGASAQFAITDKGIPLIELMLQDLRGHGELFEGVTAKDIYAAKNTLGIDIGEGTVNFPVFRDGRFNSDISTTMLKGYGTVLDQALAPLAANNIPFGSRRALVEFMLEPVSPLKRTQHQVVDRIVSELMETFSMQIEAEFRKILSKIGVFTEVIYVYGGGANAVKNYLYDRLIEVGKDVTPNGVGFPILYLDSNYSRYLNREGLYSIARHIAEG